MDVQLAFFQTCQAAKYVYVAPPRESCIRGPSIGPVRTTSYVLVNANAKWQMYSDELLRKLGFTPTPLVPQLIILQEEGPVVGTLPKIVDHQLLDSPGERDTVLSRT